MSATDVPEGVALARAGWRYRRMVRILQDVKDAEQLAQQEHAEVDARYEKYLDDKRAEYRTLRAGFTELTDTITNGVGLLPAEIELAGEWLEQIPPPTDAPEGVTE